ncbi:hypothetical protein BC833DRAFT_626248 [Globomyces pollinis-pini]|nr:hypothetical protein BC833DRAFT_626248 [Globomyces pollinis-pini]
MASKRRLALTAAGVILFYRLCRLSIVDPFSFIISSFFLGLSFIGLGSLYLKSVTFSLGYSVFVVLTFVINLCLSIAVIYTNQSAIRNRFLEDCGFVNDDQGSTGYCLPLANRSLYLVLMLTTVRLLIEFACSIAIWRYSQVLFKEHAGHATASTGEDRRSFEDTPIELEPLPLYSPKEELPKYTDIPTIVEMAPNPPLVHTNQIDENSNQRSIDDRVNTNQPVVNEREQ